MDDPLKIINRTGASDELVSTFQIISGLRSANDTSKYSDVPVMAELARTIVGAGGRKKDVPIFEMCHLVGAVNQTLDGRSKDLRRWLLFVSEEIARPSRYREWFKSRSDALSQNSAITDNGIELTYPDGSFQISFSRMPFLSSLYELFLELKVDGQTFSNEFLDLMDTIDVDHTANEVISFRSIQEVTNLLSSRLRAYRQEHLPRVYFDSKFDRIVQFLSGSSGTKLQEITDDRILQFWATHSKSNEFRTYKNVFGCFTEFINAHRIVRASMNLAEPVSQDGSLDVSNKDSFLAQDKPLGFTSSLAGLFNENETLEWTSPLVIFDEEPASKIKFLKKKSERQPLENMMTYGPIVREFPLSFLRLETFGQKQSDIINDLRQKRGSDAIAKRLDFDDLEPYTSLFAKFENLQSHIKKLQMASFWALIKDKSIEAVTRSVKSNVVRLNEGPSRIDDKSIDLREDAEDIDGTLLKTHTNQAKEAFLSLIRKGFDEDLLKEPAYISGFRTGAGALIIIGTEIERFIKKTRHLVRDPDALNKQFDQDKLVFRKQLNLLYGAK